MTDEIVCMSVRFDLKTCDMLDDVRARHVLGSRTQAIRYCVTRTWEAERPPVVGRIDIDGLVRDGHLNIDAIFRDAEWTRSKSTNGSFVETSSMYGITVYRWIEKGERGNLLISL